MDGNFIDQSEEEEAISPDELDYMAPEIVRLPYDEAIAALTDKYENTKWTDKEIAAQKVAHISDLLNYGYNKSHEITLDTDVGTLAQTLLRSDIEEDDKIAIIEEWRQKEKEALYNTEKADGLITAVDKEKLIDEYATDFRRRIISGDRGLILDGLARGAEASIAPLADTADIVFDTKLGDKLRNLTADYTNPDRDRDIGSLVASGVGSVVGFAGAAAVGPVTALSYLGGTLASQGKQVYETALKETGSEEAAKTALVNSTPGIALGAFADRLIGGTLASVVTSKRNKAFLDSLESFIVKPGGADIKTALTEASKAATKSGGILGKAPNAITGVTAGAVGMGAQSAVTGAALADVTGEDEFLPSMEQVLTEAAVGGFIGGAVGGARDLKSYWQANAQFKANNKPEVQADKQPSTVAEFLQRFVRPKDAPEDTGTVVPPPTEPADTGAPSTAPKQLPTSPDALFARMLQHGVPLERVEGIKAVLDEAANTSKSLIAMEPGTPQYKEGQARLEHLNKIITEAVDTTTEAIPAWGDGYNLTREEAFNTLADMARPYTSKKEPKVPEGMIRLYTNAYTMRGGAKEGKGKWFFRTRAQAIKNAEEFDYQGDHKAINWIDIPAEDAASFREGTQTEQEFFVTREYLNARKPKVTAEEELTSEEQTQAINARVHDLVNEQIKLYKELGPREEPRSETDAAEYEDHIKYSIRLFEEARRPDVVKTMQQRLMDYRKQQLEYNENPELVQDVKSKWSRIKEIDKEIAAIRQAEDSLKQLEASADNSPLYDMESASASGDTVLSGARAMPLRGAVPFDDLTTLQKIIPEAPPDFVPSAATSALVHQLMESLLGRSKDVSLVSQHIMGDLTLGLYDPRTVSILIRRELFRDQAKAKRTFDHEAGHLLDAFDRTKEAQTLLALPPSPDEPIEVKLIRAFRPIKSLLESELILREARDLSSQWRSGWPKAQPMPTRWMNNPPSDPRRLRIYNMLKYRNDPRELFADIMSAIMAKPKLVEAQFPNIWKAFQEGLDNKPYLKRFWNEIGEMHNDPDKVIPWIQDIREKGRVREAKAEAKQVEKELLYRKELEKGDLKNARYEAEQRLLNKYSPGKEVVDKQINLTSRDITEEAYGKLYSGSMVSNDINRQIDEPIREIIRRLDALTTKIPVILGRDGRPITALQHFKNLLRIDHVLQDTTEEMANIKANPAEYRDAIKLATDEIARYYSYSYPDFLENAPDLKLLPKVDGLEGDALVAAGAKIHAYFSTKIRNAVIDQIDESSVTGVPLTDTQLRAIEILKEGAFDARRFMANPDISPQDAPVERILIERQLGSHAPEMQKILDDYHDVLFNYMWPKVNESGMLTPKLLRRLELNRRSYTMFNAIKYFEQDPHISGSLRKAIGNINAMGDELAASIRKVKMVGARAAFQTSSNAAVELAIMGKVPMKEITPEVGLRFNAKGETDVFIEKLYETQKKLQAEHPENSYLISTEEGKSTLWEIHDPRWSKMFAQSSLEDMPVVGSGLKLLESFNRIFGERELKTALSPGFWLRSKFYDISQESLVAGTWELPLLPFHLSKPLRDIRRDAATYVKNIQKGVIDAEVEGLFKYNGLLTHLTEESGGPYAHPKVEHAIYERLGVKIPKEEELDKPLRINKKLNSLLDKVGFGKLRKAVETDELRAKVAMYLIGKRVKNMSDARAARLARELGGTPDPMGGGIEAPALNKLFLFGRAHINGLRGLYSLFKDSPGSFAIRYMYQKGLPRMLMSSAIMAPLIGALFGEEEGEIYKKFLDKVPSFDKLSKMCIPFGFVDENGDFRGFDVSASEINANWKASYLALPISRDLVTADTIMSPIWKNLEDYIETGAFSAKRIAKSVASAMSSTFTGQLAPGIMSATRLSQFASGGNPYDYYRNKGIYPKDVEEAGTFLEKFYTYSLWSANQLAPGLFSFDPNKQASTEPSTVWDQMASVPIVGTTMRAFVRKSNYGDLEKYREAQQLKVERDAEIRLGMGDDSRKLYNDYKKAHNFVTRMGKGWAKHATPEERRRVHLLENWHSRAYRYGFNGMRAAFDNEDLDALKRESEKLEAVSRHVVQSIE